MPKYVLHYFDGKGRAEVSRFIFVYADIPYTDNRIKDWPATKADSPLGQLPYLEIDGIKLPQSIAIGRYLAKEAKIAGKNHLEQAQADAVIDTLNDATNAYVSKVFSVPPEQKEETEKKFLAEEVSKHLENAEKLIGLYGKDGHAVGDSLTWADFHIFVFVETLLKKADANILDKYQKIKAILKTVESIPKIAAYIKSRPETQF